MLPNVLMLLGWRASNVGAVPVRRREPVVVYGFLCSGVLYVGVMPSVSARRGLMSSGGMNDGYTISESLLRGEMNSVQRIDGRMEGEPL